jgi:glycosyltransferase involved in cell wall biosynthesis
MKLQIPSEKKVVLYFGYIWDYKGIDVLLHALKEVVKQTPDVLLVIAGTLVRSWEPYEKIIQQNNLIEYVQKHLHYIPESDIHIYFAAADLVVLPYVAPFDTHGGVGALAVALRKPILVSDIGGLPAFVKDKRAIIRPGDSTMLAEQIITILNDKTLLTSLTVDAEAVAKEIDWDVIAKQTMDVYTFLMTSSS